MESSARLAIAATLVIALPLLAGCLGGEGGRTAWAYSATQLDAVNDLGRTGKGVRIAVLDTGIDPHHASFRHLLDGDDSNGELKAFRDFLGTAQGPGQAFDEDGHGTHVAGIIAARGGSGTDWLGGISLKGGAPDALLLAARVCRDDACDASVIPAAINWAVAQGAHVISLSLGGEFGLSDTLQELSIEQAVRAAVDSGVVVIASAGNKGPDNEDVESPASLPDVIAVGAVDRAGRIAQFSSRGDAADNQCLDVLPLPILPPLGRCPPHQKPELVAPGVEILSTWSGGGAGSPCRGEDYCVASGTSQATPFVTAAVALLLEGRPDLPNRAAVLQLKQVLVDTAMPVEGQALPHDNAAGYGLVQARTALAAYA